MTHSLLFFLCVCFLGVFNGLYRKRHLFCQDLKQQLLARTVLVVVNRKPLLGKLCSIVS